MDSLLPNSYPFFLDPTFSQIDFSDLPDFSPELSDPFQLDNEPPAKRRTRVRAAKACLACRSRHMKCDSVEPKCTRCQLDAKTCVYTKSRRGGSHKICSTQGSPQPGGSSTASSGRTPGLDTGLGSLESQQPMLKIDSFVLPDVWDGTSSGNRQELDLVSRYYEYFHPGHPIALPQTYLMSRRKANPGSLEHLIPVLEYIGSKYDVTTDSDQYQQRAVEVLESTNVPATGFSVQALLLFALAKHCSDEYDLAGIYIVKATDLALSIGMDQKDFAVQNGEGDSVLEESWRRTWWWLYMADAAFAAIGHRLIHRLQSSDFVVDLPCEDWEYEDGVSHDSFSRQQRKCLTWGQNIPSPRTFVEYDSRELFDEEVVFSSMTYLIDVLRIASSIMPSKSQPFSPGSQAITAADAKLVNWFLYLPRCKHEAVKEDGKVDEPMFLAHVTINM
jgi:hypothetical protein